MIIQKITTNKITATGISRYRHKGKFIKTAYCLLFVALIFISVMIQAIGPFSNSAFYKMDKKVMSLVGESRDDVQEYLKLNSTNSVYEFSAPTEEKTSDVEQKLSVELDKSIYSASLPRSSDKGITYTDTKTDISIKIKPNFSTLAGEKVEGGHIVYPFGRNKLVYTLKYDGLKEDIVIPEYFANNTDFSFELSLPVGVEAKLDHQGNIGIYSASPVLFGNISYSSEKDQQLIKKAREAGEKTNLIAKIPAPIVIDSTGKKFEDKAKYSLGNKKVELSKNTDDNSNNLPNDKPADKTQNNYQLKISAYDLKDLKYPISVDPTISTSSSSEFLFANDGSATISDGKLTRGVNAGGTSAWSNNSSYDLPEARSSHITLAFGGYIYAIGGATTSGTNNNRALFSKVNLSTGALEEPTAGCGGSSVWCLADPAGFSGSTLNRTGTVWNGYIYMSGGGADSTFLTTVALAKINPKDGTLGSWGTTTAIPSGRRLHGMLAYDNYLYVSGGCYAETSILQVGPSCQGNQRDDVIRARINADGTIGSWSEVSSSISGKRQGHGFLAHNGYMYIIGGATNINEEGSGDAKNETLVAKIDSSGNLSTWQKVASGRAPHYLSGWAIKNGYIYSIGGGAASDTTGFAPLNANGTVTNWYSGSKLIIGRNNIQPVSVGDFIYIVGGTTISGRTASVERTSVLPVGQTAAFSTSASTLSSTRGNISATAYNGNLYVSSGCNTGNSTAVCSSFALNYYYAAISDAGDIGSFSALTSQPLTFKYGQTIHAYGNRLYIVGGCKDTLIGDRCTAITNDVEYSQEISSSGDISGSWTTLSGGSTFSTARMWHSSAIYNNKLYISGGCTAATTGACTALTADVQIGTFDSSGSITFAGGTAVPNGLYGHSMLAYNGYVYVVGGCITITSGLCTALTASMSYGALDSNGAITTWSTRASALQNTRYLAAAAINNGNIVVSGGCTGAVNNGGILCDSGELASSQEYAVIGTIGDISGNFAVASQSMTTTRLAHALVSSRSVLYNIGGCSASGGCATALNSIEYAFGGTGGSGSLSWNSVDNPTLSTAKAGHTSVVLNGYLYVIGGCTSGSVTNCSTATNVVQYAPIETDGTISTWNSTTNINTARYNFAASIYNNRIYIAGGCTTNFTGSNCGQTNNIEFATPNSDGSIPAGGWDNTNTDFTTGRQSHGMTIERGFMYVAGGTDSAGTLKDDVQYSQIDSFTGALGSWSTTTVLPSARQQLGFVSYNGYLYTVGGCTHVSDCTGNNITNKVYYAQLSSGSISGGWQATTDFQLPKGQVNNSVAVDNGVIYLSGGLIGSAAQTMVQTGHILSGGKIGVWRMTAKLPAARYSHSIAAGYGTVFVTGGHSGSALASTVYSSSQQVVPRVARYSMLKELDVDVTPAKLGIAATGGIINGNVTVRYATANSSSVLFGANGSAGVTPTEPATLRALDLASVDRKLAKYVWIELIIDDGPSAIIFPDSATNIINITMYYHPNTAKRLRGGKTFQDHKLKSLDAAPL